ncbi:hypothetical protein D049_4171A, partial [Vibrio parahaemolyticus VPTS-2010]
MKKPSDFGLCLVAASPPQDSSNSFNSSFWRALKLTGV